MNYVYAALTEGLGADDRKQFDREIAAEPGKPVSRGTGDLKALMGGRRR